MNLIYCMISRLGITGGSTSLVIINSKVSDSGTYHEVYIEKDGERKLKAVILGLYKLKKINYRLYVY